MRILKNHPFVIVRGAPGAGKSTFAKILQNHFGRNAVIHETDDFFMDQLAKKYFFNPKLLGAAHSWNQGEVIRDCRDFCCPMIVANTFCQAWEVKPYLKIASEFDRPIYIFTLRTEHDNVHGVPDDKVARMRLGVQHLDWAKLREQYDVRLCLDVENDDFQKVIECTFK